MNIDFLLLEITNEYHRAEGLFPKFHSNHEGYAVIKEELDELWDLVKMHKGVQCTVYNEGQPVTRAEGVCDYDNECTILWHILCDKGDPT